MVEDAGLDDEYVYVPIGDILLVVTFSVASTNHDPPVLRVMSMRNSQYRLVVFAFSLTLAVA
jgi:hypothetical protein